MKGEPSKKKLKIALCFRGRAAGYSKGNPVRALEGQLLLIKKHIVQDHEADVFLHCWTPSVEKKLLDTYKPIKYIIEDEIIFDEKYEDGMENVSARGHVLKKTKKVWGGHHKLSVLYSICKSLQLKKDYEEEQGFKYDVVFLLRYDIDFLENFDYSKWEAAMAQGMLVTSVCTTAPALRKSYTNMRIWDLWFAGSTTTMDVVAMSFEAMKDDAWYLANPAASIHQAWNNFFKKIGFDKKKISFYRPPKAGPISVLTRNSSKRKKTSVKKSRKAAMKAVALEENLTLSAWLVKLKVMPTSARDEAWERVREKALQQEHPGVVRLQQKQETRAPEIKDKIEANQIKRKELNDGNR